MPQATLSSKNQIVIPKEARQALGVKAGDKLLVVVAGDRVIVLQKPRSHRAALKGLALQGQKGAPYAKDYLQRERDSWR